MDGEGLEGTPDASVDSTDSTEKNSGDALGNNTQDASTGISASGDKSDKGSTASAGTAENSGEAVIEGSTAETAVEFAAGGAAVGATDLTALGATGDQAAAAVTYPATIIYEGKDYTITATFDEKAKLPAEVTLSAVEILPNKVYKDENGNPLYADYEEYYEKTLEALEKESRLENDQAVKSARFFDITFLDKDGNAVEPAASVSIAVKYKDALSAADTADTMAVHFEDTAKADNTEKTEKKDNDPVEIAIPEIAVPEILDTKTEVKKKAIQEISFEAENFSVYGVIGTELITDITLPGSDDIYEVSVTYGLDAKIPKDATLDVKGIDKSSAKYEKTKEEIIAAKKAEDEDFLESSFRMTALDISILDTDGKVVEPAEGSEVSVSIKMKTLPGGASEDAINKTLEVQHLNVISGETVVETVAGTADVKVSNGSAIAEFTLDSFSTFALTWTDGSATIHWGTINDNGIFEEFDAASLDTSVGSIDLRASYSGYEYADAVYYVSEPDSININVGEAVEGRTFINNVITKEKDGDDFTWTAEDTRHGAAKLTIASGSHIYAVYQTPDPLNPHNPTPSGSNDIPTPITNKHVSPQNEDGTYTISLEITGKQVTETHQTGANVVLVFDDSVSMQEEVGNKTRLQVAKEAMETLVSTLKPGTNDIQMALVHFGVNATKHEFSGSNWTAEGSDITGAVNSLTGQQYGTNWHEALQYAYELAAAPPDDDPTYVIFITDGCPSVNSFENNSDNHASAGTTNTTDPCYVGGYAYAKAIAGTKGTSYSTTASWDVNVGNWWSPRYQHYDVTITKTGIGASLYGIYTGTDSTNLLNTLINSSGGVSSITASSEQAINSAFQNIASTIVNNLGATGVTTTDGVTELSSVSADGINGAAGAFEYYRRGGKNADGTTPKYSTTANGGLGETWTDAPGAIYNDDGSVTWDLSSIGATEADVTYVIQFKVWPSQKAYDLIADLNNETKKISGQDGDVLSQINVTVDGTEYAYDKTTQKWNDRLTTNELQELIDAGPVSYSLKTNTNLNTSYTFKGQTYTDPITDFENGDMSLVSSQLKVTKEWDHDINPRNEGREVHFYLLVGEKYYNKDGSLTETAGSTAYDLKSEAIIGTDEDGSEIVTGWTEDSVYIAPGFADISGTTVQVKESGHEYKLVEHIIEGADYQNYNYEFSSQTVRPMVIGNETQYFVLIDDHNPLPDGKTAYTFSDSPGKSYYQTLSEDGKGTLKGTNHKTSEIDITKKIDESSLTDKTEEELSAEKFTYTITLTIPKGDEEYEESEKEGIGYYIYSPDDTGWKLPEYDSTAEPSANSFKPYGYEDKDKYSGDHIRIKDVTEWTHNNAGQLTATFDVTFNRTQIIRLTNLPTNTTYKIVESAANGNTLLSEGYTVSGVENSSGITPTQTTIAKDTISGTISTYDERYYHQFSNKLNAVDVNIAGTKQISGYEWSSEKYHFTLTTTGTNPVPGGSTGKTAFDLSANSGNEKQTDTFGRLRFTGTGTYTYTISETNASSIQVVNGKAIQFGDPVTVTIVIKKNLETNVLYVDSVTGSGVSWDADSATANATITNTAPTTEVSAKKAWLNADGTTATAPDGAKVTFALYADNTPTGDTVELDGTIDENGETAEWEASFNGLQKYKVVDGGYQEIIYTIGESVKWLGYDLLIPDGAPTPYTVTNGGTLTNQQSTLWVQFKKTDMTGDKEGHRLPGAVFTFNDGTKDITLTSGDDGIMSTTPAEGETAVNKFELAIRDNAYAMTELLAPDGYNPLADVVNVSVSTTGVSAQLGNTMTTYDSTGKGTEDDPYVVVITNSTGAVLPYTGGPGTFIYTLSGITLLMASALMYIFRMRRRERRVR